MRWTFLICALALAGCERRTLPVRPEPGPSAEPADAGEAGVPQVPPGCERSLAGRFRLAGRTDYWYAVTDDGRQVVARLETGDGGTAGPQMLLERSPRGFVGQIRATARTARGRECAVTFRAEIVACDPAGFTVRSWDAVALDEDCHAEPAAEAAIDRTLLRE